MAKKQNFMLWACAGCVIAAGVFICWMVGAASSTGTKAARTARLAVEYSAGGPEMCRVIEISGTDSIIDHRFFAEGDSREVMELMGWLSERTMAICGESDRLLQEDARMAELSRMSNEASRAMQDMMRQVSSPAQRRGNLSGWKVKVVYDRLDAAGNPSRCQRWLAVDPSGQYVLDSYDLPVIPEK